jgi:3-deoxy-D-arabino-heptulosonate 7-phosphate (DAHP) synthase
LPVVTEALDVRDVEAVAEVADVVQVGARNSELVEPMSLAAAAAGADGVMVEVHPDPGNALCDGPQSLSCEEFGSYVARLQGMMATA